jgi:hypothetical protein
VSLVKRLRARRTITPDDPVVRRLSETLGDLAPHPRFRQQLRREAINQYVASREARLAASSRAGREMGRLGRAVLYASVGLALGTTAVGAAAQNALPGEPLYGVKLRLEELRIEIAPESLRPQLVSVALDQRLAELETLTAQGKWQRATQAADQVDGAATRLAALGLGPAAPGAPAVERHAAVLNALLSEAPAAARPGLEHAIAASGAATGANVEPAHVTQGQAGGKGEGHAAQTAAPASASPHPTHDHPEPH